MPLDGTELGMLEKHPLAKLGVVERLLATEQQWCKGKLRDSGGRHCLVGAMQAVEGRQVLEPIILRAAREVGGKRYWRIESFNDDPHTTYVDVLRALRRARENIIAGMIDDGRHRPWHEKFVQALRAMLSGSVAEVRAALRFGAAGSRPVAAGSAATRRNPQDDERAPAAPKLCEVL